MPRPAPFRIAQISDLHLTARDGDARSEPKLLGSLRGMNAAFRSLVRSGCLQPYDLILVTGDVTDRGHIEAWRVFWQTLAQVGLKERVLVLPGNHDVCCLGLRLRPQRHQDLARARRGINLGQTGQPTEYPWARQVDPRVVIFGLETNNEGNYSAATNAVGNVGYFQLLAFGRLLNKYRDVPVKMVALHHSPNIPEVATARRWGRRPVGSFERLTMQMERADRRALRLLCDSHGVRLLVHGHLHDWEDRRVNRVRIVGAPALTEPYAQDGGVAYRFVSYTVRGQGGRVEVKLRSVGCA